MPSLNNTAESGTIGATVATGNSGGASGDSWDNVQIGTNASNTYVETPVLNGKRAYRLATGANSVMVYNQWTAKIAARWPAGMTTNYGRCYLYITAIPGVDTTFAEMSDAAGTTNRANIRVRSTGAIRLRNAANGTVTTTATILSLNTLYRVEWRVDGSITGDYTLALFLGNSAVAIETLSGTANFGGVIGTYRFGYVANVANAGPIYLDGMNVNDTGLPGPLVYDAICPARLMGPRAGDGQLPALRLADDFADNSVDAKLWTQFAFGSVTGSETGGQYQFDVASGSTGGAQLLSQSRYDLVGDYFASELTDAGVQENGLQAYAVMAQLDSSNQVYITVANGFMGAIQNVGGSVTGLAFVAYDPALHRWFRIREDDGDTFWEVSANGVFWTQLHTTTNPIALDDVTLIIAADTFLSLGTSKTITFGQVSAPVLT